MAEDKLNYRKLPGRPFSLFGVKRIWEGPDHLLWVETSLWEERYRRFYYKDIQAMMLQRTNQHQVWSIVWGVFAFLFGIVALFSSGTPYVSGFLTVFFLASLAINLMLGPACNVYLQTAVQLQRISLGRLNKALRVMNRLKDLIEDRQGALDLSTPPVLPARPQDALGDLHAMRRDQQSIRPDQAGEAAGPFNPIFHTLLFGVLTAAGALRAMQVGLGWIALGFLDLLFMPAGLALCAVALVRGHQHTKGRRLGYTTWAALIFSVLHGLTNYVYYTVVVIQHPDLSMNYWGLLNIYVKALMSRHPATMGIQFGSAAVSLILGCAGLLALRKK